MEDKRKEIKGEQIERRIGIVKNAKSFENEGEWVYTPLSRVDGIVTLKLTLPAISG